MKKQIFRTIQALLPFVLAAFATGCSQKQDENQSGDVTAAAATVYVRTITLQKRQMLDVLTVNGTIEAVNKATISSRVGGTLETIAVDEGDTVRKGDVLFRIDQRTYLDSVAVAKATLEAQQAAVKVAASQVDKAKAELHKATLDLERFKRLFNQGNASANELETYQLNHQRAKAGLDYAESYLTSQHAQVKLAAANLAIREKDLQDTVIKAPFDGRIAKRHHDPGEEVGAEQPILYMVDENILRATADLPAEFYSRIKTGESRLRLLINGKALKEEFPVTDKLPMIETTLRTFGIKADVKDDGSGTLVPGALAGMEIIMRRLDTYAVPLLLPVTRTTGSLIFTVEDGRARAIKVTTGINREGWVQVEAPELHEGMTVISDGQYQVIDGTPVQVIQ